MEGTGEAGEFIGLYISARLANYLPNLIAKLPGVTTCGSSLNIP